MPTATRFISRIQDCDDYADALSWAGGVVFNEAGADVDFRVEGVGEANALFVQGSDGKVGIGTATPARELHVVSGSIRISSGYRLEWTSTDYVTASSAGTGYISFVVNNVEQLRVTGDGNTGIGTTSPDRLVHAEVSDAVTNAVTYAQRLSHITSGTAAAGFGTGTEYELEDAGGGMDVAGAVDVSWAAATAGAERGRLSLLAGDNAALREGFRCDSNGSAALISFFGGNAQVKQAHIADAADAAGDPPTQAEYNAFVAKFNTLLADLEGYSLLASA